MTAGPKGPILLQDAQFLDEMSHFDRERIPERVVHAKGGGAFGYFEVTHDITKYCKAAVFDKIGKKTPLLARFSTVGERSYETTNSVKFSKTHRPHIPPVRNIIAVLSRLRFKSLQSRFILLVVSRIQTAGALVFFLCPTPSLLCLCRYTLFRKYQIVRLTRHLKKQHYF